MKIFIIGMTALLPTIASANPFGYSAGYGYGMMGCGGFMGAISFLAVITWVVWTTVGVLVSMWLWQQLKKGR